MKLSIRWVGAVATALALASGATSYADTPGSAPDPAPAPSPVPAVGYSATGTWQLLALVNKHRRALGLPALVVNDKLASTARAWTEQMAASGNLRHNDALFTPASHQALGMKALGENVGWNYSVPAQDTAFLNSKLHRANVENRGFRVAGFAVVRAADGRIWSTEDFGTPS
ncbi:MAG: hypothetical protein QOJ79_544 [Actinomycetota bacterium]|jgi:uncharacterized protein YkwD|nr:hypothetical protein [Actinomycetota bacterium]